MFVLPDDYGRYTDTFHGEGYCGIGWFNEDPKDWDLLKRDFLKNEYRKTHPDLPSMSINQGIGQVFRFVNEINEGDIVICPYNDNRLLVGSISGPLYFSNDGTSRYCWRRKVKWFSEEIDRHIFSVSLQNTLRSSLTCFRVIMSDEILIKLGVLKETEKTTSESFIASSISHYELIRKKFLELDSTEFELLVSYVLRSLGFDAKQEIGKVGDGGIDFEGVLDVLGVASINLQVQVKRYDKGSIGEKDIRNFRGALKKDYQGCFITLSSYNKKAILSATDKEREPIQLIDGTRFTEIFIEQYDKIMDSIYNDDNDELASKLKFKKSLLPI